MGGVERVCLARIADSIGVPIEVGAKGVTSEMEVKIPFMTGVAISFKVTLLEYQYRSPQAIAIYSLRGDLRCLIYVDALQLSTYVLVYPSKEGNHTELVFPEYIGGVKSLILQYKPVEVFTKTEQKEWVLTC